jgi:hypothetical protein
MAVPKRGVESSRATRQQCVPAGRYCGVASKADPAVQWLLAGDPAVAALARRGLFGERVPADSALESPVVQALMADLAEESTVSRPYRKWGGAHWRLVSLVELGV